MPGKPEPYRLAASSLAQALQAVQEVVHGMLGMAVDKTQVVCCSLFGPLTMFRSVSSFLLHLLLLDTAAAHGGRAGLPRGC